MSSLAGAPPTHCDANASPFVTLAVAATCEVCPGAVFNGSLVDAWCSGHGTCNWDAKTCACDPGFAGESCAIECPGGAANPCHGNGVCSNSTGQCFCSCDSATNVRWAGTACNETGCPCDAGTANANLVCTVGTCDTVCGARLLDSSCAGSFANDVCTCAPGFFGADCTSPCLGVNSTDGTGAICGGRGVCSPISGICTCDPCHTVVGDACVEDANVTCLHFGSPGCITFPAVNGSIQKGCNCVGAWGGLDCSVCRCPAGVGCNSISGACDFAVCAVDGSQFTQHPGNLTANTVCANVTTCQSGEFQTTPPTPTSDRGCAAVLAVCDFSSRYQSAAPTATSNRRCNSTTVCAIADGSFQTASGSNITDATCVPISPCNATSFQTAAPTLTTDRECAAATVCSIATQFIGVAVTATTDRSCSVLTACNYTTQFDAVVAGPRNDRQCAAISPECDPLRTLDLNQAVAPSRTSDRVCVQADDCVDVTCENAGECVDGVHAFTCDCATNFVGEQCEFFDACGVSPCLNAGDCTTSAIGDAVCACTDAGTDACCGKSADGSVPGDVCLNSTEAETTFKNVGAAGGGDDSSNATTSIIMAVAVCVVLLVLVVALVTRERNKKDAAEKAMLAAVDEPGLNPVYGHSHSLMGPTGAMFVAGNPAAVANVHGDDDDDVYDVANKEQEYSAVSGHAGGALYDAAQGDALDAVYDNRSLGVGRGSAVYDTARVDTMAVEYDAACGGAAANDATYDNANNARANSGAPGSVYDEGDDTDFVYPVAQAPVYAVGSADDVGDDVYDNLRKGTSDDEATYGLREESEEATYGLANANDPQSDDTYGLDRASPPGEELYSNDDAGDATYGLRDDVAGPSDAQLCDDFDEGDEYQNRRSVIDVAHQDFLGTDAAKLFNDGGSSNSGVPTEIALEADSVPINPEASGYLSLSVGRGSPTLSSRSKSYGDAFATPTEETAEAFSTTNIGLTPDHKSIRLQSVRRDNPSFSE
jgi:hypothetical protein